MIIYVFSNKKIKTIKGRKNWKHAHAKLFENLNAIISNNLMHDNKGHASCLVLVGD